MKIPLKRPVLAILIPATILIVSACNFFAPQNQPLDLLDANPAATEVAALRATATVETDRQMATLEAINTAVRAVDVQSTRIAATLLARGTAFIDTSLITPLAPTALAAGSGDGTTFDSSANSAIAPLVTPGGGAQGNAALTPSNPNPAVLTTPTPLPGAEPPPTQVALSTGALTQITLTRAVGANDCPTSAETVFTTADAEIYVTAVAQVSAGSQIVSRWLFGGTEIVSYDWIPDFNIDGACIWFYMPASAVEYSVGSWTVELSVDGVTAGSASFTIEAPMTEGG